MWFLNSLFNLIDKYKNKLLMVSKYGEVLIYSVH